MVSMKKVLITCMVSFLLTAMSFVASWSFACRMSSVDLSSHSEREIFDGIGLHDSIGLHDKVWGRRDSPPPIKSVSKSDIVDGMTWHYSVCERGAKIVRMNRDTSTIPQNTTGSITIPATLGGLPVVEVDSWVFDECSGLTSITIPASVIEIEQGAFSGCSSLTSLHVAEDNAIYASVNGVLFNKALDRVITCPEGMKGNLTLPVGVTSIGDGAFRGRSGLAHITLPVGIISIDTRAFSHCSGLTSMTLPVGVTSIGYGAFDGCSGLTSVTLPESVTSIGHGAFSNCSSLTSVTLPARVTSIDNLVFLGCSALTSIGVAEDNANYASVDGVLFNKDLSRVIKCPEGKVGAFVFPKRAIIVDKRMFFNCSALTSITLSADVTWVVDGAFDGCSGLMRIDVAEDNGLYASIGGVLFNKDLSHVIKCPEGMGGDLMLPEGVTSIKDGAFRGCSDLTRITLPVGVISIGSDTFSGCSGLTSVTLPEGVTSIGSSAFSNCSALTDITLPASVISIENGAFDGCPRLRNIQVAEGNVTYASVDGVLFDKALSRIVKCPEGRVDAFVLPESVTSIGGDAFRSCLELTSLTIPEGVTLIGHSVFSGCSSLTSISLPAGVRWINPHAFLGCSSLTNLTIPASIISIGENAFGSCSGLTRLTFEGNAPTRIGERIFGDASPDLVIYYSEGATGWTNPWHGIKTQMIPKRTNLITI